MGNSNTPGQLSMFPWALLSPLSLRGCSTTAYYYATACNKSQLVFSQSPINLITS
jgi:hypothetical protein